MRDTAWAVLRERDDDVCSARTLKARRQCEAGRVNMLDGIWILVEVCAWCAVCGTRWSHGEPKRLERGRSVLSVYRCSGDRYGFRESGSFQCTDRKLALPKMPMRTRSCL
jgi:hypothetical protein